MNNHSVIRLGHGSGGKLSYQLMNQIIIPILNPNGVADQNDAAIISAASSKLAFSTDSYVVNPIFFPGGNIGDLAVNGTVNDLAMMGATPRFLSIGFIIEEGFRIDDFTEVLKSMKAAAEKAEISIVTGDTKVVPKGKGDKIYINTSGIGIIDHNLNINGSSAKPGDKIIINGTIADHGVAVLSEGEQLEVGNVKTDSAPLNHQCCNLISHFGSRIHVLRDPTRGGVATTLNEIAIQSNVDITLYEDHLPISEQVLTACEMLGIDPLYVANEGKMLVIVAPEIADETLALLKDLSPQNEPEIIGEVCVKSTGWLTLQTLTGSKKVLGMLSGDSLPRIC